MSGRRPAAPAGGAATADRCDEVIHRILRASGVELLTRIAGLLLSAIAVRLVADAIRAFVKQG
jgi:multiple antibiotic resistance protein